MTNEDYSKVPPPHLLKKFSEQARKDSEKRGHPGYCKTFAKLCIDWAFREATMDDLRVASAEVSGAASQPGLLPEIERRSDIIPPLELVEQWFTEQRGLSEASRQHIATRAAQWGSDQELEACCHCFARDLRESLALELRAARRPKPPSLKEQALQELEQLRGDANSISMGFDAPAIRRALEQLDD